MLEAAVVDREAAVVVVVGVDDDDVVVVVDIAVAGAARKAVGVFELVQAATE